ncbi:MAG: large conductance mechanosensitive channel protein MscL, partial [Anaerolineaceae bacterium]|nr:large conductance mechanosensitive channel protein MscL [Anaerolineaceae bacterium]
MLKEFKAFVMRGNVLDLGVAVIMGTAFNAIVNSLVKDILMPPLGLILKRVDFSNLYLNLDGRVYPSLKAAQDAGAATLNYGLFIQALINFVIMAFAVFVLIRVVHRLQLAQPVEPVSRQCPYCLSNIARQAIRCP